MFRGWRFWVGVGITALLLALLFYRIDLHSLLSALARANYLWVIPSLAVYFFGLGWRALRWKLLLNPLRPLPLPRLYSLVSIGYMANNLLPARLGEVVRAYILGEREGVSKASVLGTILVERVFDGLALLALGLGVSLFIPFSPWLARVVRWAAAMYGAGFAIAVLAAAFPSATRRLARPLFSPLPLRWRERAERVLSLFLEGIRPLLQPGRLFVVLVLSLAVWTLEATVFYLMGFSFSLGVGFPTFLVVTAAANLATTLPSSQGGVGPFEFFAVQTLVLSGVAEGQALAYTLALHAVILLPVTLVGLALLGWENLSLGEVLGQRKARAVANPGGKE